MTAPETMTMSCPSEETLAAFVDGRLNGEARRRVVEHMANCGECRDIAVLTAQIQAEEVSTAETANVARFPNRTVLLAMATAVAAMLVVVFFPALQERMRPEKGIPTLIQASTVLDKRVVDGRLTGFPYKPRPRVYRSGNESSEPLMDLAVAEVRAETQGKTGVDDLHAEGVALLFAGKSDLAIKTLEEAVRKSVNTNDLRIAMEKTKEAALLNDLSAAYYARGTTTQAASDITAALNAAQRAWQLAKTSEIAWNRALALSHFSTSTAAWDDFLRINEDPQWREEAEERKSELKPRTSGSRWREVVPRIETGSDLTDLVAEFPEQGRVYFEDVALPNWANAQTRGSERGTEYRTAAGLASALAQTGDQFALAVMTAIDRACAQGQCADLAAAHLAFESALATSRAQNHTRASVEMEDVARRLERLGSPLALRARFEQFAGAIHANDYDLALDGGRMLLAELGNRSYRTLEARTLWLLGLCELQALRLEEALQHYRAAEQLFDEGREEGYLASIRVRLADALEFAGESDDAMSYRLRALHSMRFLEDRKDLGIMLYEAGQAAMSRGWPNAADVLLAESIAFAREMRRPDLGTMAALWRANRLSRVGDIRAAVEQVRVAREFSESIADRNVRERVHASTAAILGRTSLADRPYADLTEAIEFFERSGARTWVPQLLHARALLLIGDGDRAAAERDLQRAITIAEATIGDGGTMQAGDGFSRDIRDTYGALIGLLVAAGRTEDALMVAERARLIGRIPAQRQTPLKDVVAKLSPSVQVAVFETQPASLVVWVVKQSDVRMFVLPATPEDLGRAAAAAERGELSSDVMARLYDLLMRPWLAPASSTQELVIAPAPGLEAVPFAALYDEARRRHVIDDFTVSVTLSLTEFANRPDSIGKRADGMLIVADAAYRSVRRLPAARKEALAVGELYEGAMMLLGHDATGLKFLAELGRASMLHFAGHAQVNEHQPQLSALVLGGANGADDRIYIHELLKRPLPLDLVVLSACSTAQTRAGDLRGNITIARAFVNRGARAVVATLQPVPDDAAAAFSIRFHEALRDGASPAAAVRAAQLHIRSRPRSDAAWAAFCVIQGAA